MNNMKIAEAIIYPSREQLGIFPVPIQQFHQFGAKKMQLLPRQKTALLQLIYGTYLQSGKLDQILIR